MISGGLLVLLGLVVWFVAYGPPEPTRDTAAEGRSDTAFAELAAQFDPPPNAPDRTIRPR